MNGIVWADDSQVAVLRECRKGYSDVPRVIGTVERAQAMCAGQANLLEPALA